MISNLIVVFKKDGKWFTGTINGEGKLRKNKQILKLSDVTNTVKYFTLKRWLKENTITDTIEDILGKYKVTSLYINTEKAPLKRKTTSSGKIKEPVKNLIRKIITEKEWWSTLNPTCVSCEKNCKQSSFATIVSCNRG